MPVKAKYIILTVVGATTDISAIALGSKVFVAKSMHGTRLRRDRRSIHILSYY